MSLLKLTLKSILNRKFTTLLLIISIMLSSALILSIHKIRLSSKKSFNQSISNTDLIIGPRSGDIQLLLYTLFRKGDPISSMSYQSVKKIKQLPAVKWLIPLSMGDSHKGFPVIGTTNSYFNFFRYHNNQQLTFKKGAIFKNPLDIIIGSDVSKKYGYQLGQKLYLSHGMSEQSLANHHRRPFIISGILKKTGTPVDKTLHIQLSAMDSLHFSSISPNKGAPKTITSCLVGLHSKLSLFYTKNRIINWPNESLSAIIPGLTLSKLWSTIHPIDTLLRIINILVFIIICITLQLSLLLTLHQRKNELSILRSIGAHPKHLVYILLLEASIITVAGIGLGILLMISCSSFITPILSKKTGLIIHMGSISSHELLVILILLMAGLLTSTIPAIIAYKKSKQTLLS